MRGFSPLEYSRELLNNTDPIFSYKTGEDIEAFQREAPGKLKNLLGIDSIEREYLPKDAEIEYDIYADDLGAREISFTVESENNVFVPCHLFIPDGKDRPMLIVALHGHSTGMHTCLGRIRYPIDEAAIAEQDCDFARQAIEKGYAVLTLEHRGFGERGGDEKGARCSELSLRAIMIGRTLLGERIWDAKIAIDAVINSFADLVDTQNIIALGYSGGGSVGTYLSAIDKRIKSAVIVSAISTFKDSIGAMPHCACNYVPSMAKYFDMGGICQLIAPRRLVVISGNDDRIFPISGAAECVNTAKSAFAAFNAEDMLTHISANGGHKFYPREAWNAIKKMG